MLRDRRKIAELDGAVTGVDEVVELIAGGAAPEKVVS